MKCLCPRDLLSLITACPRSFSIFWRRRRHFLDYYKSAILAELMTEELLIKALLTVRLRRQHERSLSLSELGHRVYFVLHRYQWDYEQARRNQQHGLTVNQFPNNLPVLAALWDLLAEADEIISVYGSTALGQWEDFIDGRPGGHGWSKARIPLSPTEKCRFREAVFRFESYCHAFFQGGNILFPGRVFYREILVAERMRLLRPLNVWDAATFNFYSVVHYVINRHYFLHERIQNDPATSKTSWGILSSEYRLQLLQLQDRTPRQVHMNMHQLCFGGIRTLLFLEHASYEAQVELTLSTFLNGSHSVFDMKFPSTSGLTAQGPWLYGNTIFGTKLKWELAGGFWDRQRLIPFRARWYQRFQGLP